MRKPPKDPSSSLNDRERRNTSESEEELEEGLSHDNKLAKSIEIIEDEDEAEAEYKARMLLISFISMVVASMGNRIFQKLQTVPMFFSLFFSLFLVSSHVCLLLYAHTHSQAQLPYVPEFTLYLHLHSHLLRLHFTDGLVR